VSAPLTFGPFVLDAQECRLTRDGQSISLSPRPFDLLVALVNRAGRLVSREELLREVWKDTVVEQSSLNAAMSVLRQALGDEASRLIETVPGRGYRFLVPVTTAGVTAAAPADATSPAIRVVVVDDHAVVRMGVRALIERAMGFSVVGEAATFEECGVLVEALKPDLLVLDLMMGGQPSLDHIAGWRKKAPSLRVVMLSMHHEDDYARRALAAGAHGYVMKAEMLGDLQAAIASVVSGGVWVSPAVSQSIVKDFVDSRSPSN
jgi:DNA-binding response OmpR family regulator